MMRSPSQIVGHMEALGILNARKVKNPLETQPEDKKSAAPTIRVAAPIRKASGALERVVSTCSFPSNDKCIHTEISFESETEAKEKQHSVKRIHQMAESKPYKEPSNKRERQPLNQLSVVDLAKAILKKSKEKREQGTLPASSML